MLSHAIAGFGCCLADSKLKGDACTHILWAMTLDVWQLAPFAASSSRWTMPMPAVRCLIVVVNKLQLNAACPSQQVSVHPAMLLPLVASSTTLGQAVQVFLASSL